MGNTGIRRKSLGGQSAFLEVTKASVEVIANQMKEMVSATKETKSNKLEVQLKLFLEQMTHQREGDMRIYEQGLLVADNAHLAIIKQGEVVSALANISHVLSMGLKMSLNVPNTRSSPPSDDAPTFPNST